MATVPVPTFQLNGATAFVTFLYVVATFGALHLLALSKPNARLSQAWLSLGF